MGRKIRPFFLLLSVYCLSSIVYRPSYARPNVSVTEEPWIYHALDKLVAFGLIDNALLSQKPISISEALRLQKTAKENLPRLEGKGIEPAARILIKQLEEALPKDPPRKKVDVKPLTKLRLEYLFLDSPEREVPESIASHNVNAKINPLIAYRAGRPFLDGHNFVWEMGQAIYFEPYFSIVGQPQFFLQRQDDSPTDEMHWSFDHLYLRSEFKNIGIQFGRDQVVWGPTPLKGNVFSANARGQDMFKLSNVSPFHLPWFLKYLGWMDASFFFSVLESDREFSHAYITAFKLSFLPHKNFEFGFTAATMSGGEGSPNSTFARRLADPVLGYLLNLAGGDSPIDDHSSNRIGGFDFRWRLPPLRGLEVYYEVTFEDLNTRYKYYLETFNRGGIYIPRLSNDGKHALRLEYNYAGFLPYRHIQFRSGWTRYRRLMGDEMGPDSQGIHFEHIYNPTRFFENRLGFSFEQRDSDIYSIGPIPEPVTKTADGPAETRIRFLNGISWKPKNRFEIGLAAGFEKVKRFNFVEGDNRNNLLANLRLTWFPVAPKAH